MDKKVLPASTPVFYENYKEPLRKVENGYGYMGTLAANADKTHVQCHICGKLYKFLGPHINHAHGTSARSYKREFGLMKTTALIGEKTRELRIAQKQHLPKGGELPVWLAQYNQEVQTGVRKHYGGKRPMALEKRNKLGVCPDQLLEKITLFAQELGRTPSCDEFRVHYEGRYLSALMNMFGGWNKAVRQAGMTPVGELHKQAHSPRMLIKYLRDFKKQHSRIPVTSDFSRGLLPARYHYHKVFGTLNDARVAAGMNAIVALPRHLWMEIPAKEWHDYKIRLMTKPYTERKLEATRAWNSRRKVGVQ